VFMVQVTRTFTVQQPTSVVVGYLKDFARAEAWDPGTKSCRRTDSGDIRVGSTWQNVSSFRGRETELEYTLRRLDPDHLTFVGKNKTATSTDDITFSSGDGVTTISSGDGVTTITYSATIEFHGLAKLAAPFLQSTFDKLADETEQQMTDVLNRLG
jgi:carbon monoxide dehydrogenase subunit G